MSKLSELLTNYKAKKKITYKELGDIIGYTEATVYRISNGERNPSFKATEEIAEKLGYRIDFVKERKREADKQND